MTKTAQRKLLRAICNNVRDALLSRSGKWPSQWDGHELRELVALAHDRERTNLMRTDRKRRSELRNAWITSNFY